MRRFALLIAVLLGIACLTASVTDAGLFRRRSGEPRTPVRTAVRAAFMPVKLLAQRRVASYSSCGSAYSACATCTTSAPSTGFACNDASCLAEAEKAFHEDDETEGFAAAGPPLAASAFPHLVSRESRLTAPQRVVWKIVKNRPAICRAVARYAAARGYGTIDPTNLAAVLDVLLAFFNELWPLILSMLSHSALNPPLILQFV